MTGRVQAVRPEIQAPRSRAHFFVAPAFEAALLAQAGESVRFLVHQDWVQDWVQVATLETGSSFVSCAGSTNVLTATNQEVAGRVLQGAPTASLSTT